MVTEGGGKGVILAAPTERGPHMSVLREQLDVEVTLLPEGKGCDFLWSAGGSWYGVQRKEARDLVASLEDGRLAKEIAQARVLGTRPWLILEGQVAVMGEAVVIGRTERHVKAWHAMLLSIEQQGWSVVRTNSGMETGWAMVAAVRHTRKEKHGTGRARPKAAGAWGQASSKEWAGHLLQGFDGVGPDVARAIVEELGLPLAWTVSEKELMSVPGVGKVRARKLIRALERSEG